MAASARRRPSCLLTVTVWSFSVPEQARRPSAGMMDAVAAPPARTDDAAVDDPALEPAPASRRRRRRRRRPIDVKLLFASLAIALGVVMIGFALLRAETGGDIDDLPEAIERITPVNNAVQVLSQTEVFVDLEDGYEGRLIIDQLELETARLDELAGANPRPGSQVETPPGVVIFDQGSATLTYVPVDGAPIERFDDGVHTATVVYWPIEDGEQAARSFTWSFQVV
jgi:hypothetical protein